MGQSEYHDNSVLFIKYRKIDHGRYIGFFPILKQAEALLLLIFRDEYPKSLLKEMDGILQERSLFKCIVGMEEFSDIH